MAMREARRTGSGPGLLPLALLVSLPWCPALPAAATPPENRLRSTLSQTACDEIREQLDLYLADVPRVNDAALDREVSGIMSRLQVGAMFPSRQLDVLVLDEDEIAAHATPCDQILLTRGMLEWQASLAEQNATATGADPVELARGYTASVLAHELAHVLLGHTGELVDRPLGLLAQLTGDLPRPTAEQRLDRRDIEAARYSQEREFAADRLGALYLLRSGWEIQQAMDTFRGLDALARSDPEGCFYCLEATSYLSTHPRSSEREAAVEMFRAELKTLQTAFDNALPLIIHNTELDHAIALLDEVLVLFPDLLPVKHARAVALQTKWANPLPAELLRVQMSLPVYSAYFLGGIRGSPGLPNRTLWEQARKAYHEVLLQKELPYAVSNLAVLDAYAAAFGDAGASAAARRGAERASELAPDDVQVLNNLGVVLYLTGDAGGARAAFERATVAPYGEQQLSLIFNLGRTLADAGEARGRDLLGRYASMDPMSPWGREAMWLAGTAARGPATSPEAGIPAPVVAGVRLNDSREAVEAALGGPPPDDNRRREGVVDAWVYEDRGLRVYIHQEHGVTSLVLIRAGVATVFGVDVDDPLDAFREHARERDLMPSPARSLSKDEPRWSVSPSERWSVSVVARDDTIVSICVKQNPPEFFGGS